MNAEIICIGTELLLGHIINTNASFIAKKLAELGIDHYFQTTVGDNPARLYDTIKIALARSDIVITTGGLGPTVDDITTQIISDVTNKKLILEKGVIKDINGFFRKLHKKIPKDTLRQALIPKGAKWLRNSFGTAPGFVITIPPHPCPLPYGEREKLCSPSLLGKARSCIPSPLWGEGKGEGKIIIALPGPPREMQPMVENYVIPYLKQKVKGVRSKAKPPRRGQRLKGKGNAIIKSRSIKLIGLAEAAVNEKVKDLLNLSGAVTVGIYARLSEVELKIMAKAKNESSADREIAKVEKAIRGRLKKYIYGVDNQTLEAVVGSLLSKKKKTLAVAESCTGGLIGNLITNVPGASAYFKEGLVVYSNESKVKYLDVLQETIKKYGSVSGQAAKEMAKGIRKNASADIGLAVTGIAGPSGGTRAKPIGLVYIALACHGRTICKQFNFAGTRSEIKFQAAQAALNMVRHQPPRSV